MQVKLEHGPQKPSQVPLYEPLKLGRSAYGAIGRPLNDSDYRPAEGGGFTKRNGSGVFNYIITSGAWWLHAGDRPRLSMTLRTTGGAYAQPAILPGLGVAGQLRAAVTANGKTKWLDAFETIEVVLAPGEARWVCADGELGVTLEVEARQFISVYGFAATARLTESPGEDVTLTWAFGRLGGEADSVEIQDSGEGGAGPSARLATDGLPYTRVLVATAARDARAAKGGVAVFDDDPEPPVPHPDAERPCVLFEQDLAADETSRFLCVWGYDGYDEEALGAAWKRIEFRPFADPFWVEGFREKWFEHWIGRGLDCGEKFRQVRADSDWFVQESRAFWERQRSRVRIETPEPLLDNVVNATAAYLRMQYDYPGFLHGLTYCKYGKINCGYYGMIDAGYRDEVENSLKFISGTQCPTGRQRYFMPAFALSPWAEEVDLYFVEQVWYHWRWTGDDDFLRAMWPAVRRTLEHALAASDPDGDGVMTGYYEMWNCDTYARGGLCALQTAMGWSALRAAAEMAAVVGDVDHESHGSSVQGPFPSPDRAVRYESLRQRFEDAYNLRLWDAEAGAWCSAEWNGDHRPRPANHEQNYAIWRGLGDPMRNYMAMRYVRDTLWQETEDGAVGEFNNFWWPIMWSHHYVANGDTAASIASACDTGDIDAFWPAMKTVYESAYWNGNAALYHATGSHSQEMGTLFIHSVVHGLFGVRPWLGDNLIVLRPSLLAAWPGAGIGLDLVSYSMDVEDEAIRLEATTPEPRRIRAELPVAREIAEVRLNGEPVDFRLEPGVHACRVVVESGPATSHRFEVRLAREAPAVLGDNRVVSGHRADFTVRHAEVLKVHDPQDRLAEIGFDDAPGDGASVHFTPRETGRCTAFVELRAGAEDAPGAAVWYHPLDLQVFPPWEIVQRSLSGLNEGGPAVLSPAVDSESKTLHLEIANHGETNLFAPATVTIAGRRLQHEVSVPTGETRKIAVALGDVWDRLSPGSVPFTVAMGGQEQRAEAVAWDLSRDNDSLSKRLLHLDIADLCNINLRHLYSPRFQWRLDYTGCAVGVDWRDPMPPKDDKGYVLMNAPVSQFEYGVLPEQYHCTCSWDAPRLPNPVVTPAGIDFVTAAESLPEGGPATVTWRRIRGEGSLNRWERHEGAAVMSIEGGRGSSTGYEAEVNGVSTDDHPEVRLRVSGSPNARFYVEVVATGKETILGSKWRDTPADPTDVSFPLPGGKRVESVVLYTMTTDGRAARNRFLALEFAGADASVAVDLEDIRTPEPGDSKHPNTLALASTEPYEQLPSAATLELPEPRRLEKIYLLTANLTKTLKCYYPGAEVIVRYDRGDHQVFDLTPPWTMPCFVQEICPRALAIPFGEIVNGAHPLNRGRNCHLAVTDIALDPERRVREIEFRCVASETVFGLLGATALEAGR